MFWLYTENLPTLHLKQWGDGGVGGGSSLKVWVGFLGNHMVEGENQFLQGVFPTPICYVHMACALTTYTKSMNSYIKPVKHLSARSPSFTNSSKTVWSLTHSSVPTCMFPIPFKVLLFRVCISNSSIPCKECGQPWPRARCAEWKAIR